MKRKTKVFILYASAGSGHFRAAQAIYDYFKERNSYFDLCLIDALDYTNLFFKSTYQLGYRILIGYLRFIWAIGFKITENVRFSSLINSLRFIINRLNSKCLRDFLIKENPDFVICTHFFPTEVTAYLKKKNLINSLLIVVITDLKVHPFWINSNVDIYITALEFTTKELESAIPKEKIKNLGIPVNSKFYDSYNRVELANKLGVSSNNLNVLLVMGSLGLGPLEKIIKILHNQVNLWVVCGNNKRLYQKLLKKNYSNIKVFGFVENIQDLIHISDLIITKPGGITIFEILVCGVPAVFVSPIPGQETGNIEVLEKYQIVDFARNLKELRKIIIDYKNNPEKLIQKKEKMQGIKVPYTSKELYDVICKSCLGYSRGGKF